MKKTVKGKILVFIVIGIFIVATISNLLIWSMFYKNLKKNIINDMENIKNVAIEKLNNVDNKINKKTLDNKINNFKVLNWINNKFDIYVSLMDEKNNEFCGESFSEKDIKEIHIESEKKKSLIYIRKSKDYLYATLVYPIYKNKVYVKTLILQKEYNKLYLEYSNLIKKILLIQVISFLILILILYIFLNKITYPLHELSKTTKKISEGDYSNILKSKSNDDIGILVDNFNLMQGKIMNQMYQLEKEKNNIKLLEKQSRDFFNYATHEMKTPITAISGYTQLLTNDSLDDENKARAYKRITIECERMHKMIQNMTMVTKGDLNFKKEIKKVNIKELIDNIAKEFNTIFEIRKVKINTECEEIFLTLNEEEIRVVFLNLIENAVKYSSDGQVFVAMNKKENVQIFIKNKCYSIPDNIKDDLFKPFIKYSYGDASKVSSGLGLFICKELVERNKGEIIVNIANGEFCLKVILPS